jgi:hypothetical protein
MTVMDASCDADKASAAYRGPVGGVLGGLQG